MRGRFEFGRFANGIAGLNSKADGEKFEAGLTELEEFASGTAGVNSKASGERCERVPPETAKFSVGVAGSTETGVFGKNSGARGEKLNCWLLEEVEVGFGVIA